MQHWWWRSENSAIIFFCTTLHWQYVFFFVIELTWHFINFIKAKQFGTEATTTKKRSKVAEWLWRATTMETIKTNNTLKIIPKMHIQQGCSDDIHTMHIFSLKIYAQIYGKQRKEKKIQQQHNAYELLMHSSTAIITTQWSSFEQQ